MKKGKFNPRLLSTIKTVISHEIAASRKPILNELVKYNIHIIICGLNGDRNQKKFGQIIDLIPLANKIDKLSGICTLCNDGTPGDFSILKKNQEKKQQILVGGDDMYQCVCRKHIFN